MPRKTTLSCTALLLLLSAGCHSYNKTTSEPGWDTTSTYTPRRAMLMSVPAEGSNLANKGKTDPQSQPFIQTTHTFELVSKESSLPENYQSILSFCASIRCEVQQSAIKARARNSPPSGYLFLRVFPQDSSGLFAHIEKQGKVVSHETSSVDKTDTVVDTEARIKNHLAFRDNLRRMLSKSSISVKDSLEIQEQLNDVQILLDAAVANRKALANETDKVAVVIDLGVEQTRSASGGLTAMANAFRDFGSELAASTAYLISAIASVLPWVAVILPAIWALARIRRRRKEKMARSQPPLAAKD